MEELLDLRPEGLFRRLLAVYDDDSDVALEVDVTDPDSCERFVDQAVGELGAVDILLNGAGLALGRDPFDKSTEQDERTVLETNVNGLLRVTRLCLPHIRDGGHIVNIGSIAGRQAYPNGASYVTSKFAVRGFTYALREDLLGRPIRITTVDAGLVGWAFSVAASANLPSLVMLLFWKRTTKQGIAVAITVGMLASLGWILLSADTYKDVYGLDPTTAIVPFSQPGIVTIPLGFLVLIAVSLVTQPSSAAAPRK